MDPSGLGFWSNRAGLAVDKQLPELSSAGQAFSGPWRDGAGGGALGKACGLLSQRTRGDR